MSGRAVAGPWPLEGGQDLRALAANFGIELVRGQAAERIQAEGSVGARLYYALDPSG